MKRCVCSICGYVYNEAKGALETGVLAGTCGAILSDNRVCPLCGAAKAEFRMEGEAQQASVTAIVDVHVSSSLKIATRAGNECRMLQPCAGVRETMPSAISMVPKVYPPQQRKTDKTVEALRKLARSKTKAEGSAAALPGKLAIALE